MARRIDIELTSARPDGTWTWRAAGALKPRGVLDGNLLTHGAKPGDVLRVDAEFEIEGITIVAVLPPKEKKRVEPDRLEVIGPPRAPTPGVTTSLSRPLRDSDDSPRRPRRDTPGDSGRNGRTPTGSSTVGESPGRGDRPQGGGGERGGGGGAGGPRGPRQDRPRVDRGSRPGGPVTTGTGGASGGGAPTSGGGHSNRGERDRGERGDRRPGAGGGAVPRSDRPARPARDPSAPGGPGSSSGSGSAAGSGGGSGPGSGGGSGAGRSPAATSERPKARRLAAGNVYRNALLETLPPEHRPIAEQVIRGGIPAVRTALHLEAEKATAEGRPAPHAEELLAIAEEILPKVKAAEWRDRADAAAKVADELPLRDLRSIVEGASAARDDESRNLAASLRETLERRVATLRSGWIEEIQTNLAETRVVRALRLSARPPDATTKLPSELAAQLTEAAGKAMSPDTPSERWAAMLEAVVASPVRRQVKPQGLPTDATEPLLQAARQQSGRVPALAAMLGISMPPPPGPIRPPRPQPTP